MMPTIIQTFCTKRNLTKCEKEQEELNSGMCKRKSEPTTKLLQSASAFSCAKKGSKRPINAIQTVSDALVWYILSK